MSAPWLAVAVVAALLTSPAQVSPDQAPAASTSAPAIGPVRPIKIGFVDLDVVIDKSAAVRQIVSEIDSELAGEARVLEERNRELRRLRLSIEQQGSVLSDSERRTRQEKAIDLMNEIDDMEYSFRRKVRQKQQSTIEPLLAAVLKMVGEVAAREQYDLVVRGELVLYGRDTVDLTPVLIAEMDKRIDDLRAAVLAPRAAETKPEEEPEQLPLIP